MGEDRRDRGRGNKPKTEDLGGGINTLFFVDKDKQGTHHMRIILGDMGELSHLGHS